MRAAPPVSVRGNGGRGWRCVQALLFALAAATLTFWGLHLAEAIAPATLSFAALAAAAGVAVGLVAWRLLGQPASQLSWCGQQWTLESDAHATVQGQLAVMVDLGWFMLLRVIPAAGRRRWTAITAHEAGVHWHGLRAAAYARVPPPAADADQARGTASDLLPTKAAR